MFVPDGNCRHSSQSGSIINQKHIFVRNNNVVSEFVLRDHLGDKLSMNITLRF